VGEGDGVGHGRVLDCHASLAMTGNERDCHALLAMTTSSRGACDAAIQWGACAGTGLPRFARNDGK
jgi:hypothetical protein